MVAKLRVAALAGATLLAVASFSGAAEARGFRTIAGPWLYAENCENHFWQYPDADACKFIGGGEAGPSGYYLVDY